MSAIRNVSIEAVKYVPTTNFVDKVLLIVSVRR